MLHVKFTSNLLGRMWVGLSPEPCASKITAILPCLPCLSFLLISPLSRLFKIHGLSYRFFRNDDYNSPESVKNAPKKRD